MKFQVGYYYMSEVVYWNSNLQESLFPLQFKIAASERKVGLKEGRRPLSGPKQACQMFLTEFLSSPQLAQMIGATAAAKILWTGVGEKRHQGEIMAVIVTIFHLAFFARVTPREAKRDKYISMQIYFSLFCVAASSRFFQGQKVQPFTLFKNH